MDLAGTCYEAYHMGWNLDENEEVQRLLVEEAEREQTQAEHGNDEVDEISPSEDPHYDYDSDGNAYPKHTHYLDEIPPDPNFRIVQIAVKRAAAETGQTVDEVFASLLKEMCEKRERLRWKMLESRRNRRR